MEINNLDGEPVAEPTAGELDTLITAITELEEQIDALEEHRQAVANGEADPDDFDYDELAEARERANDAEAILERGLTKLERAADTEAESP